MSHLGARGLSVLWRVALAGCLFECGSPATPLTVGDVLTLTCGLDGGACRAPADGVARIPVSICTQQAEVRPSGLTATVRLSDGATWLMPTDPAKPSEYVATLYATGCDRAELVATTLPGWVEVVGDLHDWRARTSFELLPAPLTPPAPSATPPTLTASSASTVALRATVASVSGGSASRGTRIRFELASAVSGAFIVAPAESTIDQNGAATATLLTSPSVSGVDILVTATPPAASDSTATPTTAKLHIATLQ